MIKAVKKLKFWSRKKRKKKTHQSYYSPPPPPPYPPPPPPPPPRSHCCCSCYSSSTQPSAPPLPPSWFDSDLTHDTFLGPGVHPPAPESSFPNPNQPEEIVLDSTTTPLYPTLPESNSSYQQYMVPNPVYGIPVSQTSRREKSGGIFGCVVNFGIHLIRCFVPCYRIREVR